jgi:UDP:flavonoid glycosyltransferase YjiC (YdhE family)
VRVLFSSTSGAGHSGPLLPIAAECSSLGHEIAFVVPVGVAGFDRQPGWTVVECAAPDAGAVRTLWDRVEQADRADAIRIVEREIFATLATDSSLPHLIQFAQSWMPDLIVREPCEYSSAICAQRMNISLATVAISFSATEWSVVDMVQDILDGYECGTDELIRNSPFLARFPVSMDPSPFPVTWRYRETTLNKDDSQLPRWWTNDAGPLVYISFGSLTGSSALHSKIYQVALDAVATLPVRALMTVGRDFDVDPFGLVPSNVHVESWYLQDKVLAHCDLVVCHGGSGTTFAALAHRVPTVIMPIFADQPTNANAVAGAGAGIILSHNVDAQRLRESIELLLTDHTFRIAARRISDELRKQTNLTELAVALCAAATDRLQPSGNCSRDEGCNLFR